MHFFIKQNFTASTFQTSIGDPNFNAYFSVKKQIEQFLTVKDRFRKIGLCRHQLLLVYQNFITNDIDIIVETALVETA